VKTGDEHAFKTERQTMHETVRVLRRLRRRYATQRLLLCWDSARWHRGSAVEAWLTKDQRVEILSFPRYAPEENPQEHVWKAGRSRVTHNRFIENI
jgi:transposase